MRFVLAVLFLILAFVLQFWFASFGVFVNVIFAALITFAFLFDLWDVLFFVLAAVFVVNWQPTFSWEIAIVAAAPLAAYLLHRYTSWEAWAANLAMIFLGLLALYLVAAPAYFFADWRVFLFDLVTCLVFGSIIFAALNRREGR